MHGKDAHWGHDIDDDVGHGGKPRSHASEMDELRQEVLYLRRRARELERRLAPLVARQRDPHDIDDDDDVHCPNGGRLIR